MKIQLERGLLALVAVALMCILTAGIVSSTSEPADAQAPVVPGDANCDGDTDIIDALFVALYTVGVREGAPNCPIDPSTEISLANSDLDNDGQVTIIDALFIARCETGIDTTPCEPPPPTPTIAANDQMIDAIEIFPNETGYYIPLGERHVQATMEADESWDNCVVPGIDGSVWYRFTATTSRVSIVPENDDQYAGIFRAAEGVTNPTQMSDLELFSCAEVNFDFGAIVQPGETYWVAVSGYWMQELWFFDRDPGCPAELEWCRTRISNDDVIRAIGIDLPGPDPVVIDDFNPGWSTAETISMEWSYADDEIGALGCGDYVLQSGDLRPGSAGSVWYEVIAPGDLLEIRGSDDQQVAIYAANQPYSPSGLGDLTQLACGEPRGRPAAETIPGETYFVVSWGQYPGQVFSIGAPQQPVNDELANAIAIAPSAEGTFVANAGAGYRATSADDETRENCQRGYESGSVWYRFEATTSRVSVVHPPDAPNASSAIYVAANGVAEPTQMSDLELVSCASHGDVNAIVTPGTSYWVSISHAETPFWIFDTDPLCTQTADFAVNCPIASNDHIQVAAGIDVSGPGSIVVDDFSPGPDVAGDTNIDLTYSSGELEAGTCIDPTGGSVWYRLSAPSDSLTISGGDDQQIGVYRSLSQALPIDGPVTSLNALELVGCGTPQNSFTVATAPGETYYLVASETYPEQIFSISW